MWNEGWTASTANFFLLYIKKCCKICLASQEAFLCLREGGAEKKIYGL